METKKVKDMQYEPFQYYCDELIQWSRIIEFQKEEVGDLVRKVTVGLEQANALTMKSGGSNYIDQFIVQEQKCDHLLNQINSQRQRLERTAPFPGTPVQESIVQEQDILRSRMHGNEKNFIRSKYACSLFLSECLQEQVTLRGKALKKDMKFKYDTLAV